MSEDEQYKYIDVAIDIQKEILPESKELCVSCVRKISPESAFKMAEYIYKDHIENIHRYEWLKPFVETLEKFSRADKPKVIGFIYEILETYKEGMGIKDLEKIAESWSLKDKFPILLEAFFEKS